MDRVRCRERDRGSGASCRIRPIVGQPQSSSISAPLVRRIRNETIFDHDATIEEIPMRKLKLQAQMTADGFVTGPEAQLDWMTFDMDEKLLAFITRLTDTSDTILLGRGMTEGFVKYWESVLTKPESPEYPFAQKMVGYPK